MSRRISEYDYLCKNCREHKFCKDGLNGKGTVAEKCPKTKFVDFVEGFANEYTQLFSRKWSACPPFYASFMAGFAGRSVGDDDLAKAVEVGFARKSFRRRGHDVEWGGLDDGLRRVDAVATTWIVQQPR